MSDVGECMRRLFPVLASVLVLTGCAAGKPPSLDRATDALLPGQDLVSLVRPAAELRHPRLQPITIDPTHALSPQAVAVLAVIASPDLKAARAQAQIAQAQSFAAGLLPDPSISLGADFRQSGPDRFNGWTGALAYELTALRDRGIVLDEAQKALAQVRLDLAWQEWSIAQQARLLAVRIVSLDQISRLAAEARQDADKALKAGAAAAQHGDIRADELATRRLAVVDAADRQTQALRDLATARQDLNVLLGLPPATVLTLAADPPPRSALHLDPAALFEAARRQRLDLLALKSGYESQNAAVRKAVMDRFPAFQLSLNSAQDTANNKTLGPAVSFTLPVWNFNRGGVAVARATQDALRAEYAARVFAARAEIYAAADGVLRTEQERRVVREQLVDLRRIASASNSADHRGDLSDTAATAVRQTLRDREIALQGLDQAFEEQIISLELATGGPLK